MRPSHVSSRLVPILTCTLPLALAAALLPGGVQAQIGEAVGIRAAADGTHDVLVLRVGDRLGQPAVLVYRLHDDGAWRPTARLAPAPPAAPYEGFSPSFSVVARAIAVAAADAAGAWAASVYRAEAGVWTEGDRVALDPSAGASAAAPGAVDLAMLGRIMQPPLRRVALDPTGSTLAAWVAGPDADRVRVFSRGSGAGEWSPAADLTPPDGTGFDGPVALAVGPDGVLVGAPGRGPAGVVYVFERQGREGQAPWRLAMELTGATLPPGAQLGAALDLDGDALAVGAPGAGRVLTFRRHDDGWVAGAILAPSDETGAGPGSGSGWFGAAVALHGADLWVGAPLTDRRAGAVHRFRRDRSSDAWAHQGTVRARDLGPELEGSLFGAALALAGDHAVVGAPRAAGGNGRVAVFTRAAGAGSGPAWIEAAPALEVVADGEVRCREGRAAGFDCRGVDLLAFLPLDALDGQPGERVSDLWGWADPETGREYALVGRTAGMAVVDVTRPASPEMVALVPANPSGARDIKTYGHHAFMTGDGAGDHGLVIFDLTRLRDLPIREDRAAAEPATLEPDARYTGIGSAHNLIMDPESGIAIPVGASGGGQTCGGGFHMLDVTTPLEPAFLGCYTDTIGLIAPGRSHDGQCVVYHGPDRRYRGRNICLASNETALRILDITDPADVDEVARAGYPASAYTHQGWLTEDHRYFFMNDELDELVGLTPRTRTLIWDIAELDDPVLVGDYLGPDGATDHNLFIRGNRMYQANYQAGFHVVDISDPENPVGIGSFDTTPYDGNPPGFGSGAWTAYPFLPSGTVLVSSMNEGLFLLRPRPIVP